ncbi:chromate efflux transporter [Luteimonas sp. 3794]|uniref:chromate efflux transporter n=1 Tax=Luteimonas sp. 3794 TaxID=2817730 RepID=UPI0028678A2A|nr:chromate efflux transporter [Luteimonas sp. 3794]MDR6991152.1 chromate transporter [Luteimonas sp. 3794]
MSGTDGATRPGITAGRIFRVFLRLGLTSFGGPVAHLAFFRDEFVVRRRWLGEAEYAELVALCQCLPGPASSQVGMALGLRWAGLRGALAAWCGFTLPSALLMIGFALGLLHSGNGLPAGVVHGLKLVAVAVVAQAVWTMGLVFCRRPAALALALFAAAALLLWPFAGMQLVVIGGGALLGAGLWRIDDRLPSTDVPVSGSRWPARIALLLFTVLLLGLPVLAHALPASTAAVFAAFYRAGAWVFGGGHVVLPLLEASVVAPGWMTESAFLAGYGAAQALPGPLFAFAGFLGAGMQAGPGGWAGGLLALVAVFLPGLLLVVGVQPVWQRVRRWRRMRAALAGVNAAVVGLLLAALVDPLWTSAVAGWGDVALVCVALLAPVGLRMPVWLLVPAMALCGWALGAI